MYSDLNQEFQKCIDAAEEIVVKNPEWKKLEEMVYVYLSQAPNSSDLEDNLISLIDRQNFLLMAAMYRLIKGQFDASDFNNSMPS